MTAQLLSLPDKVSPAHTALVLVDIQNDFYSEKGYTRRMHWETGALPEMPSIIPQLRQFVERVRKTKVRLVFIQLVYDEKRFSGPELAVRERRFRRLSERLPEGERAAFFRKTEGAFPCKVGTWGADFVDSVRPTANDFVVVKTQYSAFMGTELDHLLKAQGIRTTVLCGGASNMCLGTTAYDGFMLGYYVVLMRDLSTGWSIFHDSILANIDHNFGEVASSGDLLEIWKA
ncbi:MAG: cysteine hydrolase [Dehalococcoidia bacterium]|nr:cysteine hydrolase [Dehalococcoidia bacterium]